MSPGEQHRRACQIMCFKDKKPEEKTGDKRPFVSISEIKQTNKQTLILTMFICLQMVEAVGAQ